MESSLAIDTVAVFAPVLVGVKMIVKVVEEAADTGELGWLPTTNSAASVPLIATFGEKLPTPVGEAVTRVKELLAGL